MNEKEKEFKQSILNKIDEYYICSKKNVKVTFNECLKKAKNQFVMNHYNDGSEDDLIDVGIEKYLCELSPLYFISRYCKFTLPGVGAISCNNLYYYQKEILKKYPYYRKIVLTKSRQTGLSTLSSLIFLWKTIFFNKQWGVIISKDGKSSTDLLDKVKENLNNIPPWTGVTVTTNNIKGLKFSNGSKIDSFARSKSAARGTSGTIVCLDEAAFYQTASIIEGIVSSVTPSLSRTSGTLLVISTPNGTTGEGAWYYNQVKELREHGGEDGDSILIPVDWWECPDIDGMTPYKGFNKELEGYIERDYFNHPEVRLEAQKFFAPIAENPKQNEWLNFQFKTSGEVKYRQEILQDFITMGSSVFSRDTISEVAKRVETPKIIGDLEDGRYQKDLWIWNRPGLKHKYIIGVDVAKGTANDSSIIEVFDIDSEEQVAEYMGKCSTHELALLTDRVGRYYNNARLFIECNAIGEAVFNEVFYNLNYQNIYSIKKVNKQNNTIWTGWMTSAKTRELITSNFIDHYTNEEFWKSYHPKSQRLLDQMKQWVWKNGRPDHNDGAHDDAILATAIALYNMPQARQAYIQQESGMSFIAEDGREISYAKDRDDIPANMEYGEWDERNKEVSNLLNMPNGYESETSAIDMYKWLLS